MEYFSLSSYRAQNTLRGENVHIDGGKTTVGDGAADGTGKGEARVESKALELLGLAGLDVLDDGVELLGSGGHGDGVV